MIKAWYFLAENISRNALMQVGPFASREQALKAEEVLGSDYHCSTPYEGVVI